MRFTAAIVPFYRGEAYIGPCIESLVANGIPARHIYLVDNGPAEGSLAAVQRTHPELKIIRTKPRLGFGRASNIGAEAALKDGADLLLLTNQDTILDSGCIARLGEAMDEDPELVIVAPLNYTYGFEGMEDSYVKYFLSQNPSLIADALARSLAGVYAVEKVVGSCFMVRAQCVRELGLFDEIYFMYSEDEDLCRRYRLAGMRLALVPTARVAHAHSLTSPKDPEKIDLWTRRSQLVFILKDTTRPLWKCFGRAIHSATEEYFRSAARLDVRRLCQLVKEDIFELTRLGALLDSRREERRILRQHGHNSASTKSPCESIALAQKES